MKIMNVQDAVQNGQKTPGEKARVGAGEFDTLLRQELEVRIGSAVDDVERAHDSGAPAPLTGSTTAVDTFEWNQQAFEAVDAGLQKLEAIERSLGTRGADLRRMDEALAGLAQEVDGMQEKLKGLPEGHPVREIGTEMRVLAYVESVKWRRGDYV